MKITRKFSMKIKGRSSVWLKLSALYIGLFVMAACSTRDDSIKVANSTELTDGKTTSTVVQAENKQVDYFAEKYLKAPERLKRRQERMKAVLQ